MSQIGELEKRRKAKMPEKSEIFDVFALQRPLQIVRRVSSSYGAAANVPRGADDGGNSNRVFREAAVQRAARRFGRHADHRCPQRHMGQGASFSPTDLVALPWEPVC